MKKRELLERDIEAYLRKKAMQAGCQPYKFVSIARRSVPDQLILGTVGEVEKILLRLLNGYSFIKDAELRTFAEECMAATVTFAECKKPGVKPSIAQEREHAKLRARGFTVLVVDSKEQIDELYGAGDDLV